MAEKIHATEVHPVRRHAHHKPGGHKVANEPRAVGRAASGRDSSAGAQGPEIQKTNLNDPLLAGLRKMRLGIKR